MKYTNSAKGISKLMCFIMASLSDDTTMVDRMTERVKSLEASADITYKDA